MKNMRFSKFETRCKFSKIISSFPPSNFKNHCFATLPLKTICHFLIGMLATTIFLFWQMFEFELFCSFVCFKTVCSEDGRVFTPTNVHEKQFRQQITFLHASIPEMAPYWTQKLGNGFFSTIR